MRIANLVALYWICTLVAGIVGYVFVDRADHTFYDIVPGATLYVNSIAAHVVSALGLAVGCAIASVKGRYSPITSSIHEVVLIADSSLFRNVALVLCGFAFISDITAYGFNDLLTRNYYLPAIGTAAILGQLFAIVGILFAALLVCSPLPTSRRIGYVISIILILLSFAKGSRFAVLGLALLIFFPIVARNQRISMKQWLVCIGALIGLAPLLHAVLYFRSDVSYGAFAYASNFGAAISTMFEQNFQAGWELLLNLTFSVPVVEVTIARGPHTLSDLLISISPLPGEWAGWYDINLYRRISEFIPYSAIGELYGFSPFFCFAYMGIVGTILTYCERTVAFAVGARKALLLVVLIMMGILFALLAPQYNLRSSTRSIYYLLAFFATLTVLSSIGNPRPSYHIDPRPR